MGRANRGWAAVRVRVTGPGVGALGLSLAEEQAFPPDGRTVILSRARQTGQALERARLFESERDAREEAEKASRAKDEFLAILSHELRNHLSSAILAFEILKKGQVGTSGSTGAVMERSLSGLLNVVDRALSEVRLEAGTQRRALARVAAVVEEVEASAMIEAKSQGLTLTVIPGDYELLVEVDRHLFASALSNLLQNATKFTPLGGRLCMAAPPATGPGLVPVCVARFGTADHSGALTRMRRTVTPERLLMEAH